MKRSSRRRRPRGSEVAIQDGNVILTVDEIMIWTKLARGDYNRNQVYGHLRVTPGVPWVIRVPVGELDGPDALRAAVGALHGLVTEAVQTKVAEVDDQDRQDLWGAAARAFETHQRSGVEVRTNVKSIDPQFVGRPSIEASVGDAPDFDEDDF